MKNEFEAAQGSETNGQPRGRLILIIESELTEDTRQTLHDLLGTMFGQDDVTMVSGLTRAGMLQAERIGGGIFYNRREYISPETAFAMMPWREVWLVAAGRVWQLSTIN